jgi:DNA modification methylase
MTFDQNVLAYGDNLDYLRGLPTESVDLIYLDPPYNSKRDYNATFGADAQIKAFKDTWTWGKDDERALHHFAKEHPTLGQFMLALGGLLPKQGLYPYLVTMAIRLVEMQRVLKPTGSIYLHVDPTASHYLKLVMDQIFGGQNFQNELIWHYKNASRGKSRFAKSHDVILWFSKSDQFTFNRDDVLVPFESNMTKWRYERGGQAGKEMPKGKTPDDVYTMPSLNAMDKERTGYPTQKPLALLERIIKASSNEGDVVLDPYMGSGTTCVAAAKLGRRFIGLDLTPLAVATAKARLDQAGVDVAAIDYWGSPRDLASARHLFKQNVRDFDCWALMNCSAMPQDCMSRVFGLRNYMRFDSKGLHQERALYVTSLNEPPVLDDIARLRRLMTAQKAQLGLLICFEYPTDPEVLQAVADAGLIKLNGDAKTTPKLQIITVQDVIDQSYLATEVFSHERVERQTPVQQMELV